MDFDFNTAVQNFMIGAMGTFSIILIANYFMESGTEDKEAVRAIKHVSKSIKAVGDLMDIVYSDEFNETVDKLKITLVEDFNKAVDQFKEELVEDFSDVVEDKVSKVSTVNTYQNPYDLFVHMYPSLKDMDNERIDELIHLVDTYNKNWVEEH